MSKHSPMGLIKTTPELAVSILEKGNRKILLKNGQRVIWINLNNNTLFAKHKQTGAVLNIEDVELFILVPNNCSTVY